MKHYYLVSIQRRVSLLWSLVFASVLLIAYANTCLADPEKNTNQVKVSLSFAKEDLSMEKKREYDFVSLKDASLPEDEPGTPWLPAKYVNVRVPDGAEVLSVSVNAVKETLMAKGLNVYPAQPSIRGHQPAPEFVKPDAAAYKSKQKKELGKKGDTQQMRQYTFVPVRINAVRLIAATGELYLAETVEITVEYKTKPQAAKIKAVKGKADPFENMMRKIVVNPDISSETSEGEAPASSEPIPSVEPAPEPTIEQALLPASIEYLIITTSDLAASFQALANHRAAFNGVTTKIVTTTTIYTDYAGTDNQQKIRACIKDHVDNHGTLYVVLGGHSGKIPARMMSQFGSAYTNFNIPSDLYYAGLDGTWDDVSTDGYYGQEWSNVAEGDMMADVILGRIPMGSAAQVSDYITKLIKYEKTPPAGIEKKLMINGAKADSTYSLDNRPTDLMNDGHLAFRDANHPSVSDAEMWMRRLYRDCVQVHGWQASRFGVLMDTLTSWDSTTGGSYTANGTNMTTRFNENWNFVFNSTHGSPDVLGGESGDFHRVTHAPTLTGLTTIFYTDSCQAAKWDTSASVSIAMLANPNGGALAFMGHARDNTYTSDSAPADNWSTGGVADDYPRALANVIFGDRSPYMGDAFLAHQLKMNAISSVLGQGYNYYRTTMYGVSLLGDPLLAVRTEVTRPLVATHPKFVKPNQAFVLKLTRDGLAVKGSKVRIFNANERHEAVTDTNGNASFNLGSVSLSEMKIVATAPNSFPYLGEMYVQLNTTPLVLLTPTDTAASETGPNVGTWTFSRSDNISSSMTISFSLGGNATQGSDYTIPNTTSLTFPAGAASVALNLTPIDDNVFGELTETAVLTLLPNSAYSIAGSPAVTISIADNDNMPPAVNASQDQLAYLKIVPWQPSDGLVTAAWYDAADLTSITQASGTASVLKDKSGNNKHATQGTAASQPSTGGLINGVHALTFDGTADTMSVPPMGSSGSAYITYVAQPVNDTGYSVMGCSDQWDVYNGGGAYPRLFRSARFGPVSAGFPTNAAFMGAYEANSATPIYNVYNNGTRKVTSSSAFTFSDNWGSINSTGNRMTGQIGEVIALNNMPSTETRQKIEGYLAHKWGLVASLPAAHAYLTAPPVVDRIIVQLNGTTSDVESDALTIAWSKVSGPGTVIFASPSAASTQATFSLEGVYTLRLSVNDGTTLRTDDVVITVRRNQFPTANAGPDKNVLSLNNQSWTPKTGITTAAWFDAADLTTLTETSGLISQWRDKSGRGKHANQGTATARPAPLGLINGVHALTFDGTSDTMPVPQMGSAGSAYITYVAQPVNDTGYSVMGCADQFDVYNGGGAYPRLFRSARFGPVSAGFPTNAAFMGAYEANTATPIYNVYNNGTRKLASSSAFTFSDNWGSINSTGNRMTGQIGEVLALNYAPSLEVRQKIEGYLAHKWGLIAGLPADHPYKVAAPGPPAIATLNGSASDADGVPLPLTTTWTLVSGPQPVVFTNRNALITDVLFTAPGVYRFKLTADDSNAQAMDECLITINPVVAGMDGDTDGMDDAWELTQFGGTNISNGTADGDGDGFTDQQEYRCGTDPADSKSALKIASTNTISKTEMMLTFSAVEGKTYKLLASPNLTASSWQTIRTGIIGTSPTTSVSIPIEGSTMFFMIGVE